jgi:hypothetical protein
MPWWVALLWQIGLTIAYDLIRPKPSFDSPEPAGIGNFKLPTIGEGRVIPIVWGTCKIPGPMVTWYGDLEVVTMKEWVQTGLFTGQHVTTGYRYYLGMQLTLCSGEIDEVLEIRFDDKVPGGTTITPGTHYSTVGIDAMDLFGGDDQDGGVAGTVRVYHGTTTQDPDDYLEDQLGFDLPAWRGICFAVFDHVYLGTSPYIKDVSLVVRRCPNTLGLSGGDENISGDANPAAMIYDLLTSSPSRNGLGIPAGNIDVDAFRTVGATLATEGLGLSMVQDRATPGKDLVFEILRHVDGIVYVEPTTGLLTLTLVREDYVLDDLPVLDENNCTLTGFARASWGTIKNQVRVSYIDRADGFTEKTVQAQDLAAIEATGGEVSTQDFKLRGYSNAQNAQAAASRAIAGLGYPLATQQISADRTVWAFRPGTPFKLNWPKLGIAGLVCRVMSIASGELLAGRINFDSAEDVFAVDWLAYTPPEGSGWSDPASLVVPALTDQAALLGPYEAVKLLPAPTGGAQQAVVVAARGSGGISKGFNAIIDSTSKRIPYFTPSGTLASAITETTTTITLDIGPDSTLLLSQNDPDYEAGVNVAWMINGDDLEEFIAFQTVSIDEVLGEITLTVLARGCLDTAPTAFDADTRIWFMSYGNTVVNVDGTGLTTITFQPYNNLGGLALGSCDDSTVTAISPARRARVYCPTDVRFNGASYPVSISGELTVAWEHRNRLGDWSYGDSGETSDPEEDTEYDVFVYGELDTLVHTEVGVTGKTWTYLEADEIAESGLGRLNNHLRIVIMTLGDSRAHSAIRLIEWEFDRV